MNSSVLNKYMSLLVCICIVLVFVEFQFLIDGPEMSFVGEIICPQASQTCCDIGLDGGDQYNRVGEQ